MKTSKNTYYFFSQEPVVLHKNQPISKLACINNTPPPLISPRYPSNLTLNSIMLVIDNSSNDEAPKYYNAIESECSLYFILTLAGLSAGILLIPNFAIGIAVGTVQFFVLGTASMILKYISPKKDLDNSPYVISLLSDIPYTIVFSPVLEEIIFRGILLPLLISTISCLAPVTTAMFWGVGITMAALMSIIAVSILFGASHLSNQHDGRYTQAIFATLSGIGYGLLAVQFGLIVSIAAHMMNNTIAMIVLVNFSQNKKNQPDTNNNNMSEPTDDTGETLALSHAA